jgi:hypothetical protein
VPDMSRHSRCPDLGGLGDSGRAGFRYRACAIDCATRYRKNNRPRHGSPRGGIHRQGHRVCGGVYSYGRGESCEHPRAGGGCDAAPCASRCGQRLRLRPHSVSPDHVPALRPCRSRPNSVSRRCEPTGFRSTATVGRHRAKSSRSLRIVRTVFHVLVRDSRFTGSYQAVRRCRGGGLRRSGSRRCGGPGQLSEEATIRAALVRRAA